MTDNEDIFKLIREHSFTSGKCFLCGCHLNQENKTEEHVIPKWLQQQFNLWDQKLTLLNGTFIPYRYLTIPCCFECNNIHLRPFEDKINNAFKNGFEEFKTLDKESLFLWIGKIYFGLIYRELFLELDRKNPNKGTITDPEYLKSFYSHFLFLQGIRNKHKFKDFFPASIYLFKTQKPNKIEDQWDLFDNQLTPFISIRFGEIGLFAVLQDCETTKHFEELLDEYRVFDLHPIQFREISTLVLYKAMLLNRTPKFISFQRNDFFETHMMPLQGLTDKPLFDDWDMEIYANILSGITKVPIEFCHPEKGKVWTWLKDENGNPLFMDVNEFK